MQHKRRSARMGSQLREEISLLLQKTVKDPRIGFVTVTGVTMTPDLQMARVRVSVLGDEQQQKDSLKGLNQAAGFIRYSLGRCLQLRRSPEIQFLLDDSLEKEARIEELFDLIHHDQDEF